LKDVDARDKPGHDEFKRIAHPSRGRTGQRKWAVGRARADLDESKLSALAFRKFWNCLSNDDFLEVPRLLVVGKGGFSREDFVKEEFPRPGRILVDLEFLHAGLLLGLGKKVLQQAGDGAFLAGIDLPKRRYDQALVSAVRVHLVLSCELASPYGLAMIRLCPLFVFNASMTVELW
jgi:hypothetical protein